ncbi:MAG TPA: serine/threonine-protein kinase [Candidatus Xenobia bacterium]
MLGSLLMAGCVHYPMGDRLTSGWAVKSYPPGALVYDQADWNSRHQQALVLGLADGTHHAFQGNHGGNEYLVVNLAGYQPREAEAEDGKIVPEVRLIPLNRLRYLVEPFRYDPAIAFPLALVGLAVVYGATRRARQRGIQLGREQGQMAPEMTLENRTIDGWFLEKRLGEGAFARVYRGRHQETGEIVALKLLKREYLDAEASDVMLRFTRETMVQLIHKNVVMVLGAGEFNLAPYMVLEYVDGTTLRALLNPRLAPGPALDIFLQVCEGLSFAHSRGYVHRDLKPENIMISGEGLAKVADFGIAKHMYRPGATRSATTMGTPRYMSPEHLDSKHTDTRADVYSMGIILFEMLTGETPFDGDLMELIGHHMFTPPRRITDIDPALPAELADMVARLLAKQPAERYQTMDEVAEAVRAAQLKLRW